MIGIPIYKAIIPIVCQMYGFDGRLTSYILEAFCNLENDVNI